MEEDIWEEQGLGLAEKLNIAIYKQNCTSNMYKRFCESLFFFLTSLDSLREVSMLYLIILIFLWEC